MRTIACCVVALLASIAAVTVAEGADFLAVPAIAFGQEYDDNVFLYPINAKKDFITHINPSFKAKYNAPIWVWNIAYSYDRRTFAKYSYADDDLQKLSLLSTVRIVKDLLFLDVRVYADRTSLSAVRDYTKESPVQNTTQYNAFEVNPSAVVQLTSRATLTTGYQYRNVWYQDPASIDRAVHSVYGDLSRSLTERTSLNASARSDRTETALNTQTRTNYLLGARHEYQDGCFMWGRIGTSTATYEDRPTTTLPIWDAGIHHRMQTVMLSYETARTWIEDPRFIERREDRYVGALQIKGESKSRTSTQVTLAVREYGTDEYNDERKYTISVDFSHFLTEKLQAKYALTIDRYKEYITKAPDTMTIVYLTDIQLDHHATESLILSLYYRYTDSYSPDIYLNNYKVNRVLVAVKMSF